MMKLQILMRLCLKLIFGAVFILSPGAAFSQQQSVEQEQGWALLIDETPPNANVTLVYRPTGGVADLQAVCSFDGSRVGISYHTHLDRYLGDRMQFQTRATGQRNAQVTPFQHESRIFNFKPNEARVNAILELPTNSAYVTKVIGASRLEFGIPGQKYVNLDLAPSRLPAKFLERCNFYQNQSQQTGSTNRLNWSMVNNGALNASYVGVEPGGRTLFQSWCTPDGPGRINVRVSDANNIVNNGTEVFELSSGRVAGQINGTKDGTGSKNPEIYFQLSVRDEFWASFVDDQPVELTFQGQNIARLVGFDPVVVRKYLNNCGAKNDDLRAVFAAYDRAQNPHTGTPQPPRSEPRPEPRQPQQPTQPQQPEITYSNQLNYRCENGAQFGVLYQGGPSFDRAILQIPNFGDITLNVAVSGSGSRYSNGQIEWLSKGTSGILIQNGAQLNCTETP